MNSTASVIIANHNYGRYLAAAMDSALAQRSEGAGGEVEIVVVDDGSTDSSREIITGYGGRGVTGIFKENGGQGSAINAGFAASRGDVVIFLDADDVLLPGALARASEALADPGVAKVHWPMRVMDARGEANGKLHPTSELIEGDWSARIIAEGPWACANPPTSGNAFARRALREILPMPEPPFRLCADAYLLAAAPLFGRVARIDEPLSCYRIHEENLYWNKPFTRTVQHGVEAFDRQAAALGDLLRSRGVPHDPAAWRQFSWWHRLAGAVEDIDQVVPPGAAFVLIDDDQWGTPDELHGRRRVHFPADENAVYCGPPPGEDGGAAAAEQLRAAFRRSGAEHLVIAWGSRWYLEKYPALAALVGADCRVVRDNDRATIYQRRR